MTEKEEEKRNECTLCDVRQKILHIIEISAPLMTHSERKWFLCCYCSSKIEDFLDNRRKTLERV